MNKTCKYCGKKCLTLTGFGCYVCAEKRDEFAAQAMGAILSHSNQPFQAFASGVVPCISVHDLSAFAYEVADAMMEARVCLDE